MTDLVSRRIVFQGLGFLGVAVALAGCGSSSDATDGDASGLPSAGTALATTDEVPVGGGIVLSDAGIVLTQPSAGEFKAFTAVCTHQGAALDAVGSDGIECPLHGSRFSIEDGSVTQGPATDRLADVAISVDGDQISVA
ncbi:MAG TPA: Rieske (2Fe-2S) protein [Nocardioides sp.]|mgnify:CR=1 FL=1|uniref:Rieske (2Fe-2S) protein n=1 Tax=uncultured Nocardioides sp. TaxID=198441 RepID=UPI000EE8B2C4|nr:Rieske (2Fe-2S) protein [uncultured Nocardioides sp.]HCB07628.1 iron-sulfur protein [Nocardioides sp.]HRD62403.1 Rieske (2Fe-2S) protein [Nocardioides sp.]HRI99036.1 Rieske (2Fe-2S) protein [Nocardioides sp.]HRK45538.1 Rieske (2Fe-2S) protein [Nocardioides sp.]